ncbi:hypothetical protein BDY21DRAFT_285624 [Lineolata rhizophorae]|uniref:Zn(2)-C6 fungal-type domain-containing protein n=1 Tax=Lineolata rhizophorae TaxID=578093 RepID=A0A6A6P0X4_9PEZI|nr:hypothetical protein BDY21DRAFT_285624 [Lineolata rhizophorae]
MVYCGKPSRGCQTCKSRRIKCDEIRPSCTQCNRTGRTCPGYPDEFDLIFRDENAAVARRARKASAAKTSSSPGSSSSRSVSKSPILRGGRERAKSPSPCIACRIAGRTRCPSGQHGSDSENSSPFYSKRDLVRTLGQSSVEPSEDILAQAFNWFLKLSVPTNVSPSPEVQATAFFFKNFVLLPQEPESCRGFLDLLVPIYNQAGANSPLHSATHALALATLSNYPGRNILMKEARTKYGQALQEVGAAIQDPVQSKMDETIMSVLLFSLYETSMDNSDEHSTASWAHHVDGAVALTKLRGVEQFDNQQSLSVFRAVRVMMLTRCIQQGRPVDEFPGPMGWRTDDPTEGNTANRLTILSISLPSVRWRAKQILSQPYSEELEPQVLGLLEEARNVDADLENWWATLPPNWHYKVQSVNTEMPANLATADQWPGPVHIYEDIFLTNIVNDYRVTRIFCQMVIRSCAAWVLQARPSDELFTAYNDFGAFLIQQMVDEICASVPYHMHVGLRMRAMATGQEESATKALGGYFLVWPLYVSANTDCISDKQREWLWGRLFNIGRTFGLRQAQVMTMARRNVLTCGPSYP